MPAGGASTCRGAAPYKTAWLLQNTGSWRRGCCTLHIDGGGGVEESDTALSRSCSAND